MTIIVTEIVTSPKQAIELLIRNPGKFAPSETSTYDRWKSLKIPHQASKILFLKSIIRFKIEKTNEKHAMIMPT